MTKLTTSVAILALEECGYEQENRKPFSFAKKVGAVFIVCRLEVSEVITGHYTASIDYEGVQQLTKHSSAILIPFDIRAAEAMLTYELVAMLKQASEVEQAEARLIPLRTAQALALCAFEDASRSSAYDPVT